MDTIISIVHKKKSLVAIPFILSFLVILAVSLYANSLISFSMRTMEYNIERRLIAESKRLAGMVSAEELDKFRAVLGMINDILDISKIEAGRFELIRAVYETAPLLSDTLNLNKVRIASSGSAGSKPITLKLEINSDFPAKLIGDELRVRQTLNNLLSNAIK